jgi:nitric oxide reductase activation protein
LEVRPEALVDPRAYITGNVVVVEDSLSPLVRDQVVVQAAMLAVGSFEPRIMRALMGRSRSASRYCALEGVRAVRVLADLVPGSVARRVLEVAEAEGIPRTATAEESRKLALSKAGLPPAPDFFGQVRPLQILIGRDQGGTPVTGEVSPGELEAEQENEDQEEGEESKLLKALSNPLFGENAIGRMFRNMFGQSSSPSEDSDSDGSGPSAMRTAATMRPGRRKGGQVASGALTKVLTPGGGSARYPEWDERGNRYREDWVTVHESDPWNPDGARDPGPLGLEARAAVKRGLVKAALVPETRGRTAAGEQLHPDGVVDLALWRRHPGGTPPMPFADVRRTRPDVAVMVLLDASDSTQDDTDSGVSVFDQHLALAYRLSAGCEAIGLPVGLYAFQAWGRGLVRLLRVKSFGERHGGRTRARLGHLEAAGYTRMGGAIRHATKILERSAPGMKRVLVLVSDGFPYDEGYEGAYATADTRQAMLEARKLGIGCVCVGITAPSPEELRSQADALAAASALHVGDTDQIERRLGGLIRQALRDARRRSDHDGVPSAG